MVVQHTMLSSLGLQRRAVHLCGVCYACLRCFQAHRHALKGVCEPACFNLCCPRTCLASLQRLGGGAGPRRGCCPPAVSGARRQQGDSAAILRGRRLCCTLLRCLFEWINP